MPYSARSITEFWRRWHISLSQWLRDYLYIPLGGSRGPAADTYRNLWLVFLLCGLWHGANWTFVIWGVHHGLFLILERAGFANWLRRSPAIVSHAYALLAVMSGWVWFRAHDFDHALGLFASLIGLNGWSTFGFATSSVLYPASLAILGVGIVLALVPLDWMRLSRVIPRAPVAATADTVAVALLLCLAVLSVAAGSYSPFLYFRF